MDFFDPEYNISKIAGNSLGYRHTDEAKDKMKSWHKGKKLSKEHRRKMSENTKGENNPFYGKKHTEETRKKISGNHADVSGENNPKAKLDEFQVKDIKWLLNYIPQIEIAKIFGISRQTISGIKLGKIWRGA